MISHHKSGYTLVELIVVMAISAVIMGALLYFFSGSITSYRSQVGHIFATADARNQVQRITDVIRNTQDNTSNDWLQEAGDNAIAVYTDIEGDGNLEKVAYRKSGTELTREVTIAGATTSGIIMRNVANTDAVFTYYDASGNSISVPETRTSLTVKNIGVSITVSSTDPQDANKQTVSTRITPRSKLQGDVSQIVGPVAAREVSIQLPRGNPPASNASASVVIKDPSSGDTLSTKTLTFSELNDGRLSVYANKLYAILNYKTDTGLGNPAGWYVWIAKSVPVLSSLFQVPLDSLYTNQCLGVSWATVQASTTSSCVPLDTALYPITSSETFQPILAYTENGNRDYVRDITFAPAPPFVNGSPAIDLIGQYVSQSDNPLVPLYTKNTNNDGQVGVNRFGFNSVSQGISIDTTRHRLFISDPNNNRVLVYNLNSNDTLSDRVPDYVLGQANFTSNLAATTQAGMKSPRGLAYDSVNRKLYVGDFTSGRVLIYDVSTITNGENAINVLGKTGFGGIGPSPATQAILYSPVGLAYDSIHRRLYVAQQTSNRVSVFDVSTITNGENAINVLGQSNFSITSPSATQSGLKTPQGLTYDGVHNRLFVADSGNGRALIYDVSTITNGENAINVLGKTTFSGSGGVASQRNMGSITGFAYDSLHNRLFVSDRNNNRILVFDLAVITNGENAMGVIGKTTYDSSNASTTQATLKQPGGLAYDSVNSRLYVGDIANNRIMIFSTP
ncbi:MAG: hypothetical protein A3C02_04000 [Candidatus Andersenbacteria bacterium RIFCSPHIGHO2_02_FULL_45_11]|nr:MAG: hypothetical protein A2805_00715 [Candidatus Andersenbacteria bacterium RIFCSPHIGHO2_01_FULL_46_36]OGY33392.1 MAG: hypothetical protein A3C02_04000 [Candidatus Andersenbacteria bacterium RIFCSPHIGHO2_02_FULL_45_11]